MAHDLALGASALVHVRCCWARLVTRRGVEVQRHRRNDPAQSATHSGAEPR